jgi:hypothetical protein
VNAGRSKPSVYHEPKLPLPYVETTLGGRSRPARGAARAGEKRARTIAARTTARI